MLFRSVLGEPEEVGYLAQTQLFDQIERLAQDIRVPDYCGLSLNDDGDADDDLPPPKVNAWFGPKGTLSPLHWDPEHNLLAQVVGSKYIRLYSPEESHRLYPHDVKMHKNTSQVTKRSAEGVSDTHSVGDRCRKGRCRTVSPLCRSGIRGVRAQCWRDAVHTP